MLGEHSLPSPFHYLLKAVQAANLLGVEELRIRVGFQATVLESPLSLRQFLLLRDLFSDDLGEAALGKESLSSHLALAMLGAVSAGNIRASWSIHGAGRSTIVSLDSGFIAKIRTSPEVEKTEALLCRLTVSHSNPWQAWRLWSRRREIGGLLGLQCCMSSVPITLDGRLVPLPGCWALNDHLREIYGSTFDILAAVPSIGQARVAASLLLFVTAESESGAFSIAPPELRYYRHQGEERYLWKRCSDPQARPDGTDVPAWMLHCVEPATMSPMAFPSVPKRFQTVLAFNLHGPGNSDPLHLKVVRNGVLISDEPVTLDDDRLDPLRGCSVVLHDDGELTTDLSGFQLVEDERYLETLLSLRPLVELGYRTFEELVSRTVLLRPRLP